MLKRLCMFGLVLLLAVPLAVTVSGQETTPEPEATDEPEATEEPRPELDTMLAVLQAVVDYAQFDDYDDTVFENIIAGGDLAYVAPLVDIAYFSRVNSLRVINDEIYRTLAALTGEDFGIDWRAYFEWAGENDVPLPQDYDTFKGFLLSSLIDPQFERFFQDVQETAQINLAEVVWGGVGVDGIPSLVNAYQLSVEDAALQGEALTQFCNDGDCSYPAQDEFVFGVYIEGDARAYPLRLLNWHEMFNDVVGTVPLYDAPDGEIVCDFRAPVAFNAVQRDGDDWIRINGQSPDCPSVGWFANPAELDWLGEDWETVRAEIPDLDGERLNNDEAAVGQVPGKPIMLSYCTLCGAGVLYDPVVEIDGETVHLEFGSSGLLMRSNKLMYDRFTGTVWNAITGEPAFGPLAESGITLERLPVVVTDWASWVEEHPDTSVLSLDTGHQRDYSNGGAYADYFNDPDFIMFPVWQTDFEQSDPKDMIFALDLNDTPKAYFVETLVEETVTNDTLAGTDLVIVTRASPTREFFEPGGATVRAYERDAEQTFSPGETPREVIDGDGNVWEVTEDALVGPDGQTLARLPGHLAFWFGWYGFYPETLVYGGDVE